MQESFHFSIPIDEFERIPTGFDQDYCISYIKREFKKGEDIRIQKITRLDHIVLNDGRVYCSFLIEYFKNIPQLDRLIEKARPYYENATPPNGWVYTSITRPTNSNWNLFADFPERFRKNNKILKKTNWQKEGF